MNKEDLIKQIRIMEAAISQRESAVKLEEETFKIFKDLIGMDHICGNRDAAINDAKQKLADLILLEKAQYEIGNISSASTSCWENFTCDCYDGKKIKS